MSNLTVLPIEEIRMLYLTEKAKAEEIAFLCELLEEEDVVLTVSTPTGLREAEKIYKDKVHIVYAPWDFIIFVNK